MPKEPAEAAPFIVSTCPNEVNEAQEEKIMQRLQDVASKSAVLVLIVAGLASGLQRFMDPDESLPYISYAESW